MGFSPQPPSTQQPAPTLPPVQPSPQVMQSPWQYQQYPYQPIWNPIEWRRRRHEKLVADFKRICKQYGAICTLLLFTYLTIALAILFVMNSEIADGLFHSTGEIYIITPTPVSVLTISGSVLVIYYIFLIATLAVSYIFMMGRSMIPFAKELAFGKPAKHSALYTVGGMFFAVFLITAVWYLLGNLLRVSPNVPGFENVPFWKDVYGFTQASVWEEIISRVLLIGVPLLWIDLLFRRGVLQNPYRYFVGGKFNLGPVECGLIVFSALMFGMAHIALWDLWKVPPAFIVGLCLGYLFLRFGLFAAIMLHFALNFLSIPATYFDLNLGLLLILAVMEIAWMIAGVMFIVYYSQRLWRFLTGPMAKKKTATSMEPG